MIGLSDPLILLWIGAPVPEAPTILRILAAGSLVAVAITGPGTAICKGIGRPDIELRYVVVSLLVNVVLTAGLVLTIGPIGTVAASSASWALGALYFAVLVHRALKLPRAPTRMAAATLIGTGVAAGLVATAVRLLPGLAGRRDAFVVIAVCTPLGLGALLAIGGRLGGLNWKDVASLSLAMSRLLKPRGRWASGS